ncbi:hypothetical protein DFQ28_002772 [Apophysomyces sp. BC1034]|nr:hypothetical protein DFQ29_009043 [Apophysomyces sp. BC1021]KAG0193897.1 hypothetical protein DFQ28_002772 [Apophysomyces sp. BC1034]
MQSFDAFESPRRPLTPPEDHALKTNPFYTTENKDPAPIFTESDMPKANAAFDEPAVVERMSDSRFTIKQDEGHSSDTSNQKMKMMQQIKQEALSILQWDYPPRSAAILLLSVGSILLTRHHSLLQIASAFLTAAIALNFLYVTLMVQGQKLFYDGQATHPYRGVFDNKQLTNVDRQSVNHYSTLLIDLCETAMHTLTKIVLIEDSMASFKWFIIFYVIWAATSYVSTMSIVLGALVSAFTVPRLYMSNKDVVDAHLKQGGTFVKNQLYRAQSLATGSVNEVYVKTRASVAKLGTSGTDAKNTLRRESVTLKED